MRIAILFRGCHYLHPNNPGKPWTVDVVDYRACTDNIHRMILDPLRNAGYKVDIYLGTYKSPIFDTVLHEFNPVQVVTFDDPRLRTQLEMTTKAVHSLPENRYDRIFVLRFDLKYKIPITDWDIPWGNDAPKTCIWAAWREYGSDDRNGDAIFVLDGEDALRHMKEALTLHDYTCDLHGLCKILKGLEGTHIDYLIKTGCYDSATFWPSPASKNPLYVMHGKAYYFDDIPE